MKCLYCGSEAEYVGLNTVENCSNKDCKAFTNTSYNNLLIKLLDSTGLRLHICGHTFNCKYHKAACFAVGIECQHGYEVCPTCDKCNC